MGDDSKERAVGAPEAIPAPYYQDDLLAGDVRLWRDTFSLRLKVHAAEERFGRSDELAPLTQTGGTRRYFDLRPYVLVPAITVTANLFPTPRPGGALGAVRSSGWAGLRHEELGQAQAWYYPEDRLIFLWECYLLDRFRAEDPRADEIYRLVWQAVESALRERVPEVRHLYTTWEDTYDRPAWEGFLATQGYRRTAPALFAKELAT